MKLSDKVFIMILCAVLIAPFALTNFTNNLKLPDNRNAATFPTSLIGDGKTCAFCSGFDSWFNDRFGLRNEMLRIGGLIPRAYGTTLSTSRVLFGRDRWLFYTQGDGIANFKNENVFSDDQLKEFAAQLTELDNWARRGGRRFIFVIAPDKNKIYGEFFPAKIVKTHPDSESRANQLINYLAENTRVFAVYLADELIAHKDDGLLYYKNDTHWNNFGSYFAANELMRKLGRPTISVTRFDSEKMLRGDLTNMDPSIRPNKTEYIIPVLTSPPANPIDAGFLKYDKQNAGQSIELLESKSGKGKVAVLGDSFRNKLVDNISGSFKYTLVFPRNIQIGPDEKRTIEKFGADIIILEIVERTLLHMPNEMKKAKGDAK